MSFKKICICLILIFCIIGAASAAEDVSADVVDVADDSVAVDAVSDDVSDSLESVDDEAVVDESAPAQDDNDDVELEASVDDEPALDEVDDELSGQSPILGTSVLYDSEGNDEIFVNYSKSDSGDGSSWDEAYSKGNFNNAMNDIANGGTIYLAPSEEKYSANIGKSKNFTIMGFDRENTNVLLQRIKDYDMLGTHNKLILINLSVTTGVIIVACWMIWSLLIVHLKTK